MIERLVIDEAYLILESERYCPALRHSIRLRSMDVPMFYLTATLPPVFEEKFKECCLTPDLKILHNSTNCSNISIRVVIAETDGYVEPG